jgi:hypothetical protein
MDATIRAKRGNLVKDAESGQALLDEVQPVDCLGSGQMMKGRPGQFGTAPADRSWNVLYQAAVCRSLALAKHSR